MSIPSSSAITYDSLFSQSHANIFNLINNRSNVPDSNSSSGTRKFVYTRIPKVLGRNFAGYPFIVIPNVSVSQIKSSLDTSTEMMTYDIDILVYTKDSNSDSSGDPNGAESLNTISNNVIKTLNANRTTLRANGLKRLEIGSSEADFETLEGKSGFMREFNLVFHARTKVIA